MTVKEIKEINEDINNGTKNEIETMKDIVSDNSGIYLYYGKNFYDKVFRLNLLRHKVVSINLIDDLRNYYNEEVISIRRQNPNKIINVNKKFINDSRIYELDSNDIFIIRTDKIDSVLMNLIDKLDSTKMIFIFVEDEYNFKILDEFPELKENVDHIEGESFVYSPYNMRKNFKILDKLFI